MQCCTRLCLQARSRRELDIWNLQRNAALRAPSLSGGSSYRISDYLSVTSEWLHSEHQFLALCWISKHFLPLRPVLYPFQLGEGTLRRIGRDIILVSYCSSHVSAAQAL